MVRLVSRLLAPAATVYRPALLLFRTRSALLATALVLALPVAGMPTDSTIGPAHSCSRDDHPVGFHGHFASIEQAVVAATNRFNPYSIREDREYMGAVLRHKHPGQGTGAPAFTYTAAAGHAHQDRITLKLKIPSDYKIVAFWHTHGAEHWSRRYFSDVDTRLAKDWNLPFYLADFSGLLRVYKPGGRTLSHTQARRLGLGLRTGYAKGKIVTHPDNGEAIKVSTRIPAAGTTILAGGPGALSAQCQIQPAGGIST
ncbi:DUF4329 domain-containing protein [Exilibacterium tricleocarpae]|uniref:DUF4329 domain-containing protein n=1 Tax=Exilibacterium tricleocarpae TaxID=2591008 RepID=A0A545U3U5_9GAMM|nr:DUF4329 domain-containing protein [Exilibacterium tricleocarpae]TQV84094.1 DUF4329 domain-containing protein [Exilibacterium tricleocarpae]